MRHPMMILAFSLVLLASFVTSAGHSQETDSHVVWIGLANGLEAEAIMAAELRALLRTHEVEPWILTKKILIDKKQIPHSHPILTIHTRHIGEELELLSTFVHEQLHWLEDEPWLPAFQAAMAEYEKLFPTVPSSADGGARDNQSTYRHLLICDMELQAMTTLVGRRHERFSRKPHTMNGSTTKSSTIREYEKLH